MQFLLKTGVLACTTALLALSSLSGHDLKLQPFFDDKNLNEFPLIASPKAEEEVTMMENSMGFDTSKPMYFTSHPGALHYLAMADRKDDGYRMYLNDGSIWEMYPSDYSLINKWSQKDSLIITLNTSWLSSWAGYPYRVINQVNGNSIAIAFNKLEQTKHTTSNFAIIETDYVKGMRLSDGSEWVMSGSIGYWKIGQPVIVGVNTDVDSKAYPNLLINADRYSYVKANCITMAYAQKK